MIKLQLKSQFNWVIASFYLNNVIWNNILIQYFSFVSKWIIYALIYFYFSPIPMGFEYLND
jgi:hypothetical protein